MSWFPVALRENLDFYVVNAPQQKEKDALSVAANLPLSYRFREWEAVSASTHSEAVKKGREHAVKQAAKYDMALPKRIKVLRRQRRK